METFYYSNSSVGKGQKKKMMDKLSKLVLYLTFEFVPGMHSNGIIPFLPNSQPIITRNMYGVVLKNNVNKA